MFELTQDVAASVDVTNNEKAFSELADVQLALVGGGIGNVLWG